MKSDHQLQQETEKHSVIPRYGIIFIRLSKHQPLQRWLGQVIANFTKSVDILCSLTEETWGGGGDYELPQGNILLMVTQWLYHSRISQARNQANHRLKSLQYLTLPRFQHLPVNIPLPVRLLFQFKPLVSIS